MSEHSDNRTNDERNKSNKIEIWRFRLEVLTVIIGSCLAIVYYRQMQANLRQAKAAERQLLLDERAWVTPYDYSKTNGVYRVLFKNTGKTPAINVDSDVRTTDVINDVETVKWPANPPGPYSGVLGPNVDGHADTESGEHYSGGHYFFGRIWYDDIFTNRHWNDFCVFFDPRDTNAGFVITMFGNATDDSDTNKSR